MQDPKGVDIPDGLAQFVKHKANLLITEFPVLVHVLEQRPIGSVLQDQVDHRALDDLGVKADDVFVT